jgi:NADH dehydrogenase (ubiquinone) Fe-S protein 4
MEIIQKTILSKSLSPVLKAEVEKYILEPFIGASGPPTPNELTLKDGYSQRKAVVPTPFNNPERIGILEAASHGEHYANKSSVYRPQWNPFDLPTSTQRLARVFRYDNNHMQDTPYPNMRYTSYAVLFDTHYYRDMYSNVGRYTWDGHSQNRGVQYWQLFANLLEAYDFARGHGCDIDIEYPKSRYITKKHYADNFKWKGEPRQVDSVASIE